MSSDAEKVRKARLSIVNQLFRITVGIEVPEEVEEYFITYLKQSKRNKKINGLLNIVGNPQGFIHKFKYMGIKELTQYKKDNEISMTARSGSGKNGTILKVDYIEYFAKEEYHSYIMNKIEKLSDNSIYSGNYYIEKGIPIYKKIMNKSQINKKAKKVDVVKIDLMMEHIKSIMINEYNITGASHINGSIRQFKEEVIDSEKKENRIKFYNKFKKIQFKQTYFYRPGGDAVTNGRTNINRPHYFYFTIKSWKNMGYLPIKSTISEDNVYREQLKDYKEYSKKYLEHIYQDDINDGRDEGWGNGDCVRGNILDFGLNYYFGANTY